MAVTVPRFDVATFASQAALDTTHIDTIVAAFDRTGVVTGCATTASGTTMVLTVASGVVEIAGKTITVAGGTVTAVADGTNPRRSLISVNSSGTLAITSGTPLAAATGDPAIPAIPANSCPLAVVYIPAAVTALNATHLTDCRVTLRQNFDAITYYADDYANIETCVAAANAAVTAGATGAVVICGAKNYPTNGIDIGSHVDIIGQGKGNTRITLNAAQNRAVIRGVNFASLTGTPKQTPELRGDNYIQLTGFTIDGNRANQTTAGIGIQLWGKLYRWSDIVITNCFGHGMYTEYTDQYDIANHPERELLTSVYDQIWIMGNGGNGVDYHGPHDAYLNNAEIYENGGWAVNIENLTNSIAGLSMFFVNSYLNTTGSFRIYGDCQTCVGCVASAGQVGTGWDIGASQGSIKMIGCNTSGHPVGLIMRGSSNYYQGLIALSFDITGATMGAGIILNGGVDCVVDVVGGGNDYALRVTSDGGGNSIRGQFSVPSGLANTGTPSSPLNAALEDPATVGNHANSSHYQVFGTGANVLIHQMPQGTFKTMGPLRLNGLGGDDVNNPSFYSGYGAPNTVQTAYPCSTYWDIQNEKIWHKVSGTNTNTGWQEVTIQDVVQILTNKRLTLTAGTATAGTAPLYMASGTNLTTAEVGAIEYDGVQFYNTADTTQGRAASVIESYFHLAAAGATISTIANYFGTNSNVPLVANAYYIIDIELYYLKTTAGTVTWTLTNSAAPTGQDIYYEMSPLTGIVAPPGTAGTMLQGQYYNDATAARTIVTGSLTTAVNHFARMHITLKNGTGTSLKIQATASAGSITPGIGSMWRCRRISPNNIGTFAA